MYNEKMKRISTTSLVHGIILILLFFLSHFIRVVIPYNSIFTESFVRFGGADPWYNMRLVENTLHHFPHRIYFDPFTAYPHGTYNPFGTPLFDQSLSFVIWVIGLGNPVHTLGQHGIEVIGAWYPAVLGALTIIPVYYIGKELWNRNAGLLSAALIAILPGQFLARSLLGFTDHHAAETLFSTIAMLFLILSIRSAKEKEITFHSILRLRKDWHSLRKPMIYSCLAGIFLGTYYLSWAGAPFFIFILLIYAVVQYTVDHLRGASTDYLCIVVVPIFLISIAMILPILCLGTIVEFHVISLFLGIVVFLVLSAVSFLLNLKKNVYGYPIAILALAVLSFILLNVLNPSLYATLIGHLRYIFAPSESLLTIAEVPPMHLFSPSTGRFIDGDVWRWFTTTFFIAFIAFPWIAYNIAKKFRPEEILFFVWSVVILIACFGQNRFASYYAVNVAILCGFISWKIIDVVGFRGEGGIENVRSEREGKSVKGKKKRAAREARKRKAKIKAEIRYGEIRGYLRANVIIAFLIIGFAVFYPTLSMAVTSAKNPGGLIPGPEYDWYESLSWMRENTPDPGVDYYALYELPYDYPESAYSVMSWWDSGNWITRIAHRIPVANNFQQGIARACVFFTTNNETEANKVADALDVRYVVSDFGMADIWDALLSKFRGMTTWAGDTERYCIIVERGAGYRLIMDVKYYNTMVARLHMLDGTSTNIRIKNENETIPALRHYRLVHESPTFIIPFAVIDTKTGEILYWGNYNGDYQSVKAEAQNLSNEKRIPESIQPVSVVKVFEYVKGARIEGRAPDSSVVEIATNITTNQGREFTYAQRRTISNGSFEFVVPYTTEGTNFDVLASPYKIRAGHRENKIAMIWDVEKEVEVSEKEVMEGKTIRVDFIF